MFKSKLIKNLYKEIEKLKEEKKILSFTLRQDEGGIPTFETETVLYGRLYQ